ncbi:MAG: flap endonuclease-1 [Candidatus Aenigmatarchaeota archaeon]
MGVQLRDILEAKEVDLETLKGRIIAIDAFNWLYQFLSSIRQIDGTPLMDIKGRVTSHLSGLFYRTANLLEAGIKPVYVFDGEKPKFKKYTIEKRKEIREEAKEKWEKALERGDIEEAKKMAQRSGELNEEMIEESKELIRAMGLPIVQAKSEGEAQCAIMCKNGDVNFSASQDFDSLLFGSPKMIRNLNITGKRKVGGKEVKISPEIIDLEENLNRLGITREQLIIIGILVGTDYNPGGIKGIGPKKALELVKRYKTIEEVMKQVDWEFEIDYKDIYEFFLKPEYNEYKDKLVFKQIDEEKIKKILCDEHDFSEERVNQVLEKLKAPLQTSLTSWFR